MFKTLTIVFLLPLSMVSQSITGKVYDNESTAKGIQVINTTKHIRIFSNENGEFKINATEGDSLKFSSLFHHEKLIKVTNDHFGHTIIVELKKKVNELGEVLINDEQPKAFDPIDYTQQMSFGLKEDIKRNPHLYSPSSAYGLDLMRIIKLFKRKKPKGNPIETISFKAFDSLFTNDWFFNKKLLKENLKITDPLKPLFFDYCDSRNLSCKLLEKQNQIILLDSLVRFSNDFKKIIDTSKKE